MCQQNIIRATNQCPCPHHHYGLVVGQEDDAAAVAAAVAAAAAAAAAAAVCLLKHPEAGSLLNSELTPAVAQFQ
eukprot:790615-Pelagomonas_calceolata.AAC.1